MLFPYLNKTEIEAGCDEAGRGCLAGPVFAAAVILPHDFNHPLLNDSKKLSQTQRNLLRKVIEREALAWAVAKVGVAEIDTLNILAASIECMHRAVSKLHVKPTSLLIDGNRFKPYEGIPHTCIVKGDAKYMSIAAASVLAKTHRDDFMCQAHKLYPYYRWRSNKGYPTKAHREAILKYGLSEMHRKSFSFK